MSEELLLSNAFDAEYTSTGATRSTRLVTAAEIVRVSEFAFGFDPHLEISPDEFFGFPDLEHCESAELFVDQLDRRATMTDPEEIENWNACIHSNMSWLFHDIYSYYRRGIYRPGYVPPPEEEHDPEPESPQLQD
jgi:hypothetical protein